MNYVREVIVAAVIAISMPSCIRYYEAKGVYHANEIVGIRVKRKDACYEFLKDGNYVRVEQLFQKENSIEKIPIGTCKFEDVSEVFENVNEKRNPKVNLDELLLKVETIK